MTAYRRGYEAEKKVRRVLEIHGYHVVESRGSHGQWDLVAVGLGKPVLAVQVKRDGKLFPASWNELYDSATRVGALPILAGTPLRKPVEFWLLTDRKEPRGHSPKEVFDPARPVNTLSCPCDYCKVARAAAEDAEDEHRRAAA